MNRLIAAFLLILSTGLSAQSLSGSKEPFPDWETLLTQWMKDNPGKTLGDMPQAQALDMMATSRSNQARRQWVQKSLELSLHIPGAGHLMAEDYSTGAMFLTGSTLITGSGIAAAVMLLPGDLYYFNPFANRLDTVEAKFKSYSFMEYLPSLGSLAAAGLANTLLGIWAAHDLAPKAVEKAGQLTPELLGPGHGYILGAGWRY